MIQRRIHRTAPRSLALGGALAALAVIGGGTVIAVGGPTDVDAGDIRLTQNATEQAGQDATGQDATGEGATDGSAPAQEMPLGVPVDMDLEPVVARAAGGTIPDGTTVQVTGLPDGLTQDGWVISGTPTRAGDYDVLVTVSNSGVSKSQRVALTVTDGEGAEGGGADGATTTTTDAEAEATTTADAEAEAEAEATTSTDAEAEATTTTANGADGSDPTLSAVPGDPTQDGSSGEGAGDGVTNEDDDNGEVVTPDLCSTLGDGQLDGDSLSQLLPMFTGDGESSGLAMVLLNTVVNLLPSVLGEGGSIGELGSAGEFLCTISPSLLGGGSGEGAATGGTAATGAGATTGEAAAGAAALGGAPLALLGMLGNGTGSVGQ